jgi:hypothetical protein
MEQSSNRLSRRRALAMAAGSAGAAVLGLTVAGTSGSAQAAQQAGAGSGYYGGAQAVEGIVVSGTGQGAGEVTGGILQFMLRYGADAPQLAQGAAGGDPYGSVPAPDEDAVANVVEALVEAGIDEANVRTFIGSSSMYGMFGPGVSVVAAEIDDAALLDDLDAIVQAGLDAAKETNLQADQVGAVFNAADCETVSDDALAAAVADAQSQAESLAGALGIELGPMTGATATPPYSPYSGYDASGSGCANVIDLEDAGRIYFPPYVPGTEPSFTMTVSVSLTFALETAADG